MNDKPIFTQLWRQANTYVETNELEKADECFDWCLLLLAKATLRGESHYCHLKVDLWKKRVWKAIEEAGLLPE
jgi:hypothetical protein